MYTNIQCNNVHRNNQRAINKINKLTHSSNGIIYSNGNKYNADSAEIWINLKNIILNDIKSNRKRTYCMISHNKVQ